MINPKKRIFNILKRRQELKTELFDLITQRITDNKFIVDNNKISEIFKNLDLWIAELSYVVQNCGLFSFRESILKMHNESNSNDASEPNLNSLKGLIKNVLAKYPIHSSEEFENYQFHINRNLTKIDDITNNVAEIISGEFGKYNDYLSENGYEDLPENDTIFVIMSFNPELDKIFELVIEGAINKCGLEAYRVDREEPSSLITKEIIDRIKSSKLIIGDLTYERPNCYYEIGYAAALRKRMILTCRDDHDPRRTNRKDHDPKIHFDLDGHKISFWNETELIKFRQELVERIKKLLV